MDGHRPDGRHQGVCQGRHQQYHAPVGYGTGGSTTSSYFRGYNPSSGTSQRPYLQLTYSDSSVWYNNNGTWVQCAAYYNKNGSWIQVMPYYNNGGTWIQV